jgi:hypothetical protein
MKNKTIEILVEGKHNLPTGTKIKSYKNGKFLDDWEHNCDHVLESCTGKDGFVYEVDFSSLPPLYPTKGMEVGKDGIEFADGDGKLLMVNEYMLAWVHSGDMREIKSWSYVELERDGFELKRALPKTKTVCAECHKEVCECKHEMTALDVMYFWEVIKSSSSILLSHVDDVDDCELSFDFRISSNVPDWRWNELIHENGETKLKYDTWQEFTFDNCLVTKKESTNEK